MDVISLIKRIIPTKIYLEIMFHHHFHRFFSFKHPKTMNEKVQWLKVYNKRSEYTKIVDKLAVKEYVTERIGSKYIIPTLGVWDDANDIDYDSLPDQFVLKCNHDSHCVFICNDKKNFDFNSAKDALNRRLKYNEYWYGREWPYKNVKRKIMAEKLLTSSNGDLPDYKILCFNGIPENIMVCTGRQNGELRYYYFNRQWEFLKLQKVDKDLPDDFTLPKPEHLEEMFEVAEKLSKGFPFIRIDLYDTEGQVWFGEMTFYPSAGFDTDYTDEIDLELGKKMKVPF